jgi:hypothetical protein
MKIDSKSPYEIYLKIYRQIYCPIPEDINFENTWRDAGVILNVA